MELFVVIKNKIFLEELTGMGNMSDKRKFVNGLIAGLLLAVIIVSATYAGREAVTAWKRHNDTDSDAGSGEVVSARTSCSSSKR